MCELIISVIDKTSDALEIEAKLVKRGVVIDVFPDDHDYGRQERAHPMFRILKVPGASMAFGRSFLGREVGDHPLTLHRQFKIDLDHPDVPADLTAYLADDTRATPHIVVDPALLTALKRARPSIVDPHVIGEPTNVIG